MRKRMIDRACGWICRAGWMGVAALSLASTLGARAHGDQNPVEPPRMERTLFVPFDDLSAILGGENERVFLTRQQYEELAAEAARRPPAKAPHAALVLAARYETTLGEGLAHLRGTLSLEVLEPGLHALPLPLERVALRRALLDGSPAPIGRDRGGNAILFVRDVGRHEVLLEGHSPVVVTAAEQSLKLRVPPAPSTTFQLRVPGNVEVKRGASLVSRQYDAQQDRTLMEAVVAGGTIDVVLSLNNRLLREDRVVLARSVLISELTTSYERLHATVDMRVLHGMVDRFLFEVPAGFQVTHVDTPLLSQWIVRPDDDNNVSLLEVVLREPSRESHRVQVAASRAPVEVGTWRMPVMQPRDVAGHTSVLGLLTETRLRPLALTSENLIQIDASLLRQAIPASVLEAEPGAPSIRPLAAYYAPQEGFALAAMLEDPRDELRVATHLLLLLQERQQVLRGGFTLTPQASKQTTFAFHAPSAWQFTSLHLGDQQPLALQRYQTDGDTRYVVVLPRSVEAGQSVTVYFEAVFRSSAWLNDWTTSEVEFPRVVVEQATETMGAIAVQPDGDLATSPLETEGLVPLDSSQKSQFGLTDTGAELTYRVTDQSYRAVFRVERTKPRITARNYSFFLLRDASLNAHYEVVYSIERAHANRLELAFPETTPTAISIRGLDDAEVKETFFTTENGLHRWTVLLARPHLGTVRLSVDFEQRRDDAPVSRYPLPIVQAANVAYQTQMVSVEGDSSLDIAIHTAMRPVDVGELVEAQYVPGDRLLGAFASKSEQDTIELDIARRALSGLPPAIVQRAEIVTRIAASGVSQSAARYLLHTKVPLLAIRLPNDADRWNVTLNGQPVKPRRRGNQILVSTASSQAGAPLDLQVVYQSSVSAVNWIGRLQSSAPLLWLAADETDDGIPVPQVDLAWHVHLPGGLRVSRVHGTVFAVEPVTSKSPWQMLADAGRRAGGGIHKPRYGTLAAPAWEMAAARRLSVDSAAPSVARDDARFGAALGDFAAEPAFERAPSSGSELQQQFPGPAGGVRDEFAGPAAEGAGFGGVGGIAAGSGMMGGGGMGGMGGMPGQPSVPGMPGMGMPGSPTGAAGPASPLGGRDPGSGLAREGQPADLDRDGLADAAPAPDSHDMTVNGAFDPYSSSTPARRPGKPSSTPAGGELAEIPAPDASQWKYWALQGLRGVTIQIDDSSPLAEVAAAGDPSRGELVTFESLGAEPTLDITVFDQTRMTWLAWGVGLALIVVGLAMTRASTRARVRLVVIVALLACGLPVLGGPAVEFALVYEAALFAALALIPIWVLLAFLAVPARWWARRARLVAPRASLTSTLVVAVGLTLVGAECRAQDLQELLKPWLEERQPLRIPDDAVVVPYDPADPQGRANASQVLVPYQRYVELWNLAYPDRQILPRHARYEFAAAGAQYEVTLEESEYLVLRGSLALDVFSDQPVAVPLTLSEGVITSAELDGKPARITAFRPARSSTGGEAPLDPSPPQAAVQSSLPQGVSPAMVFLTVEGQGRHTLELSIRVKVDRQGGWRNARAALPHGVATALRVLVPDAGTAVRWTVSDTAVTETTALDNATVEVDLLHDGRLDLSWSGRVAPGAVDQALTANSTASIEVREDGIRGVWRVDFAFGQTDRAALRVDVPADYVVERVEGDNVRGWESQVSGPRQELNIELLKAVKQSEQVTIWFSRPVVFAPGVSTPVDVPDVAVPDAALHRGVMQIRRSPILELQTASVSGVSRTDADQVAGLDSLAADAWHSPLGVRDYQTYRFAAAPFRIGLEVTQIVPVVTAEARTLFRIGESELALESELLMNAEQRTVYQVDVAVPADLKLEQVTAAGLSDWSVVSQDAKQILTAFFSGGVSGRFSLSIRGRLADRAGGETVPLPIIEARGVDRQRGTIVIQVDPSLQARGTELERCRPVLLDRVSGWLREEQRPWARFALEYEGADYRGLVALAPRTPRVTCDTVTNVRVTYREIQETVLLDFQIAEAGVRQIRFRLPSSLRDAEITAPMIRQRRVVPSDDERYDMVTLDLQDAVTGQYRVVVSHDRALASGPQAAPLPRVDTGTVNNRYVTLENSGRDELVVDETAGMEPVSRPSRQWDQLAARLGGGDFTTAYVSAQAGSESELRYRTRQRDVVKTAGARIGLARTDFVLDAAGTYRAAIALQLDNRTEPYLEIELPEEAVLWTAHVAGSPVKPARSPDANPRLLRIPLIKTAEGDLDFPVVLKYSGRFPQIRDLRNVRFPIIRTTNINVELSQVKLLLPDQFRWFDFDGSTTQVASEEDFVAGFIAYRTQQVERLTQIIRGDNEFSKSRAAFNVGTLGAELKLMQSGSSFGYGNEALRQNLRSNALVLETATEEVRQLEERALPATDNRERLKDFYEQQQNSSTTNTVTRLGANFFGAERQTGEEVEQFDLSLFGEVDRSKRESDEAHDQPARPEQESRGLGRLSEAESKRGGMPADSSGLLDAAQQVFQGGQAQAAGGSEPQSRARRSQVSSSTTEEALNRAYADRIEQRAAGKALEGAQVDLGLPVPPGQSMIVDAEEAEPLEGRVAPSPQFVERGSIGLASLDFDLPQRGTAFYFTTPRGNVEITARPVERRHLERSANLARLLALLAIAGCTAVVARRIAGRRALRIATAIGLALLGLLSLLLTILPLFGIALLLGGLLLLRKPKAESP